jgi:hypothetical protein
MKNFNDFDINELHYFLTVNIKDELEKSTKEENFSELLKVLSTVRKLFSISRLYKNKSLQYLDRYRNNKEILELRNIILKAVSILENYTSEIVISNLKKLGRSQDKLAYLLKLTSYDILDNLFLEHERNPQLRHEAIVSKMTNDSRVVVFGSGPMPLSAITYACFGANVIMIDRDSAANDAFLNLKAELPDIIASKIEFHLSNAEDMNIDNLNPTHILLSSMLDSKEVILSNLLTYIRRSFDKDITILFRDSRESLLEIYTCPIASTELYLQAEPIGNVDVGELSPSVTYIFNLINTISKGNETTLDCLFSQIQDKSCAKNSIHHIANNINL